MMSAPAATPREMMAVAAARALRDGQVVFVGIGLPNLACNLARRLHAPNLLLIYESGAVGAVPERLPVSIGDPALVTNSLAVASMVEVFYYYLQGGHIDVGFLQGAQVDRWGNLNTTVIGGYEAPKVRLPGSGGACEIALHAREVFVLAEQNPKTFPGRLDFRTSPGHLDGGDARRRAGFRGAGPQAVITDLGCYGFADGEMVLTALHPGASLEQVRSSLGWEVKIADEVVTNDPPSAEELRLLREVLDPERLYL
jgi:glutaconate CoA-transferase subunit B